MKFLDLGMHPPTLKNEGVCFVVNKGHLSGVNPPGIST